jgi:alpha-L-arabinofuranosidase
VGEGKPTNGEQPLITVNALGGVPIDGHLYGSNNYWYHVPDSSFNAFAKSLKSNSGVTLMRFPGGFESEHYNWSDNTLEKNYRNYTAIPGVTPEHILSTMGAGNVTFVVRTQDALETNTPESYKLWADKAAELVATYGSRVQDWQIGNEWYNVGGAHKHYEEFLRRYATLVSYYAPAMKKAAALKGYKIRLFVTANWGNSGDMTKMRAAVPGSAWSDVDGLDIHIYTGNAPSEDKALPRLLISGIQPAIAAMKKDSGKNLVYASEWMATLQDDNHSGGLRNANTMMLILGEMARAGVTQAAYWPPVWPTKSNGKPFPQEDKVTLVHNDAGYSVDADGQAMKWLSTGYRGEALSTVVANTTVKSIAAKDGDRITIFVMGGQASNETEQIQINDFKWSKIVSAQVMYAPDTNVGSGPATLADISASKVIAGGRPMAKVVINPGGLHRGSSWEIVKLVLQ